MRFRTKTILGVAVIEVVLLAILVGSALIALRQSNESELTRRVQLGGKLIAVAAKDAVISQDLATLESLVDEAMASRQIDYVRILDATGLVLAQRGSPELLARAFRAELALADVTDGMLDWAGPVESSHIRHGEVQLGVSTAPLQTLLLSARRWAAGIAGLEIALVALFSWLLGSYLLRQLTELRQASHRLAAGDFSLQVPVRGDDELAETAQAFNRMAALLGQSRDALKAENCERHKAQQRAEDQADQLNAIFELSPDGFVSFDANRRVIFASPAFVQMTGMASLQLSGMDEQGLVNRLTGCCEPGRPMPSLDALRQPGTGRQAGERVLIEIRQPARRVVALGLRCSDSGSVSQVMHLRDVTLETEVDRLKSEFLSAAAHELRTPMASIYGFVEVLMHEELDAANRQEFLGIIWKHSQWMITILNELLDLARIEARRGKDFVWVEVSATALVQRAVSAFKPPEARAAPQVVLPLQQMMLRADIDQLCLALSNVLANAYKYSSGDAPVLVSLAPEGHDWLAISVQDHGIGMTPEQLSHVGERFYRADASGTTLGVGLGMSIVKEVLELHHGRVQIDSQPGQGTQLILLLPAIHPAPAAG
jgi:signal transduction histidine kinase